ncbi:hypothetical protein V6N12_011277 [Hibiscus sabdariffa]|uniref:Uncharacterized protein n=1 Tax=Hibiscus sabdariffa TaxID=183260 RepID=A0ABR2EPB2_9ROSI
MISLKKQGQRRQHLEAMSMSTIGRGERKQSSPLNTTDNHAKMKHESKSRKLKEGGKQRNSRLSLSLPHTKPTKMIFHPLFKRGLVLSCRSQGKIFQWNTRVRALEQHTIEEKHEGKVN